MIIEHNVETGEIIERELTESELDQLEKDHAAALAAKAETQKKEKTRQAVLDKLGLTSDEVAALIG